jgi:hypothetical protein
MDDKDIIEAVDPFWRDRTKEGHITVPLSVLAERDALRVEVESLNKTLRFVERWANHHATKTEVSAQMALGMIQHYPPIKDITRSYSDGVMPELTPDAWALVNDQGFISGCWRDRSVAEHVRAKSPRPDLERVFGVFFTGPGDQ